MYIDIIISSVIALVAVLLLVEERTKRARERKHSMSFMEGLDLTGFPIVTMVNNGNKFNFVLDTGSVHSLINEKIIDSLECEDTSYVVTISGIDNTTREDERTVMMKLVYKDKVTEGMFVVTDLSGVFDTVKKETGVQLHGLLGSDFFKENRYIIDYKEMIAYSKKI